MVKFNESSIMVGYIKELLHSFNLPRVDIAEFKKKISEGKLAYLFGDYIPNVTTNLKLENSIYDSYTHEYLGDYLRFMRDFRGVNLMPLYNCFSNKSYTEDNYVYFRVPIKKGTTYTLRGPALNYAYVLTSKSSFEEIAPLPSYTKVRKSRGHRFTQVVVQNPLGEKYLVIKSPLNASTNFVILEGNYSKAKDNWAGIQFNFEAVDGVSVDKYISNISLLSDYNQNNEVKPFAPKLLEYLIGNVITPIDEISRNIAEAKYKLNQLRCGKNAIFNITDSSFTDVERIKFIDAVNRSAITGVDEDILGYVDTDVERVLNDKSGKSGKVI